MNVDSLLNKALNNKFSKLLNINSPYTFKVYCNHSIIKPKLYFTNFIRNNGDSIQNDMIRQILSIDGVTVEKMDEETYNNYFPYRPRHGDHPKLDIDDRLFEIIKEYDKTFQKSELIYMENTEQLGAQIRDPSRDKFRIAVKFDNDNNKINIYIIDPHHLIYAMYPKKDYDSVKNNNCCISMLQNKKDITIWFTDKN